MKVFHFSKANIFFYQNNCRPHLYNIHFFSIQLTTKLRGGGTLGLRVMTTKISFSNNLFENNAYNGTASLLVVKACFGVELSKFGNFLKIIYFDTKISYTFHNSLIPLHSRHCMWHGHCWFCFSFCYLLSWSVWLLFLSYFSSLTSSCSSCSSCSSWASCPCSSCPSCPSFHSWPSFHSSFLCRLSSCVCLSFRPFFGSSCFSSLLWCSSYWLSFAYYSSLLILHLVRCFAQEEHWAKLLL